MRRAFFYGWVVVAVTAVVVLVTAGVRSAPGAFLAILAGFAAMAIRRPVSGVPLPQGAPAEASAT